MYSNHLANSVSHVNRHSLEQFLPSARMPKDTPIYEIKEGINPIPGQLYWVPTLGSDPIVGHPHTDSDNFNHTDYHYHVDSRFVDGRSLGAQFPRHFHGVESEPKLMIWMCLRDTPEDWKHQSSPSFIPVLASLYTSFQDQIAVCGRCPHKGMPIHNGVCTGHRLKWNEDGSCRHRGPYYLRLGGSTGRTKLEDLTKEIEVPFYPIYSRPETSHRTQLNLEDGSELLIADTYLNCGRLRRNDILVLRFGTPERLADFQYHVKDFRYNIISPLTQLVPYDQRDQRVS